jgi:anaerobic selenocysteine-containing dehydrogenase
MEVPPDPVELCRFLCSESRVSFGQLLASPSGVRPQLEPHFVEAAPDHGGRLHLCPPDVAGELALVAGKGPEQGFAFRLTSRRILHAMNGAYREARETRRRYPVNYAYMNPEDMAEAGIAEGAQVEIASAAGAIRTLARAEDRLRRGVVSMTHMFGPLVGTGDPVAGGGSNVGQLTSLTDMLEPINFMPRFSAIPVNVRPVSNG